MTKQASSLRLVTAQSVHAWLSWLCTHYDPRSESPENIEIRRLGRTLEEVARQAGAIDTISTVRKTSRVESFGAGICVPSSFDWEHDQIDLNRPHLLTNRLGSADPDAFVARLVAVTGIPEQPSPESIEPEYVL